MRKHRFILAGKEEGFEFKDAKIETFTPDTKESILRSLRQEGYRIFVGFEQSFRIDDIARKSEADELIKETYRSIMDIRCDLEDKQVNERLWELCNELGGYIYGEGRPK
jgi:hypothetical protein